MKFIKLYLYAENQTIFININEIKAIIVTLNNHSRVILQNGIIYTVLDASPDDFGEHFDNLLKGDNHVSEDGWIAETGVGLDEKREQSEKEKKAGMWDLNP